jgi:hypothetical protein
MLWIMSMILAVLGSPPLSCAHALGPRGGHHLLVCHGVSSTSPGKSWATPLLHRAPPAHLGAWVLIGSALVQDACRAPAAPHVKGAMCDTSQNAGGKESVWKKRPSLLVSSPAASSAGIQAVRVLHAAEPGVPHLCRLEGWMCMATESETRCAMLLARVGVERPQSAGPNCR